MAERRKITLRLTIRDPLPGVLYSLQDKKNAPVGGVFAADEPVSFDVPVAVSPGPKFSGEFVRREGIARRFVYIAIGKQAGDPSSAWDRRAKIDIHDIPAGLVEKALDGGVLRARLPGRDKDDGPACATVRLLDEWKLE